MKKYKLYSKIQFYSSNINKDFLCHLISTDDRNVSLEKVGEGQLDRSCEK